MNNPSQAILKEFNNLPGQKRRGSTGEGLNLNWCEKTNVWIVLDYTYTSGNQFFASLIFDRKATR